MKIGILTFHRACNYGAFLQCYSLVKNLNQRFPGAQIEVIDYQSENMVDYYKTDIISSLFGSFGKNSKLNIYARLRKAKHFLVKIKNDPQYLKCIRIRNSLFEKAVEELPLSKNRLISDDKKDFIEFVNSCSYDLIIVGSDAVWNDFQTSTPNVYYMDPAIHAKCVTYAASSYGMNFRRKSEAEVQNIAKCIKTFDFIGVRDAATEEYVRMLDASLAVHHTCDPSIILNLKLPAFNYHLVKEKLIACGVDFSKPVFGIMGGDWLGSIARKLIDENCQLVAIYEPNKYADVYLYDLTPWEWAAVFSFFTITFTHFFHGTLFSLKNGTPTMSIELESDYSLNFDTKIVDVLKRLGLSDYHYTRTQAEQTPELLKYHFIYVLEHMVEEKKRIQSALLKEAETSNQFMEYLESIMQ